MIHSEENDGFDIKDFIHSLVDAFCFGFLIFLVTCFIVGYNPIKEAPTTKPPQAGLSDKCPANTFEPIKLTGSFNSIKTDSVKTDKLNFPMWCPLIEDKPNNYGTKK